MRYLNINNYSEKMCLFVSQRNGSASVRVHCRHDELCELSEAKNEIISSKILTYLADVLLNYFLEKFINIYLLKKSPCYGTLRFITVIIKDCHWISPRASSIHFTHSHHLSIAFILILRSDLQFGL